MDSGILGREIVGSGQWNLVAWEVRNLRKIIEIMLVMK